jgi:ABC-2 type transport system ATP-binding protein
MRVDFGMTVLLTTHDMEEAESLCDELAILHAGRLAVSGKAVDLRAALSPTATLSDVFSHYCGGTIVKGGGFSDAQTSQEAPPSVTDRVAAS